MRKLWKLDGATKVTALITIAFLIIVGIFLIIYFFPVGYIDYKQTYIPQGISFEILKPVKIEHIPTPQSVKGFYITACTASSRKLRESAIRLLKETELNTIVIDLKDYTGTISYASTSFQGENHGRGCRIEDLPEFISNLHQNGAYVIARITVFQDPLYSEAHPNLAVMSKSNPSKPWKDKSGLSYIDPGATPFWQYIADISNEAYGIGFDEINLDYIRFPSDGNLADMDFTWSKGRLKAVVVNDFFMNYRRLMASTSVIISADLFGLTTSAEGDLGIGQVLENALMYFDYVSPMVYPSHYAKGFRGYAKPAENPYGVVKFSMDKASNKAIMASSTSDKLRPWLQDFDLGAKYTPDMVRAQIQATYDAGLDSWLLWNAASVYQIDALLPKNKDIFSGNY